VLDVRRPALVLCLLSAVFFLTAAAVLAQEVPEKLDGTRAALEKWVEIRRLISREQRDWALGKEVLLDRIDLVKREIETLKTRIREAEESIAEADKKRSELVDENEHLKQASATLKATAATLETRTKALLVRLPDPIKERVKPLSQRIPEDPSETKLSLSERYMNVVGILNAANKFNREITVTSEVRTLGNGKTAEVTALYVGIGQAYYVSADKTAAGYGTVSGDGWIWTPANDAAEEVARAIAILKNEDVADFVLLPVRIQQTGVEPQ
jgi:FtsZ-binding cell division protein ZapB